MNFIITTIVFVHNVFVSTHLVVSIAARMYLFLIYLFMGLIGLIKSNPHFMKGSNGNEVANFVKLFYIRFLVH